MAQENKKGYIEESLGRDAQIHFENHCSTGSLAMTDSSRNINNFEL